MKIFGEDETLKVAKLPRWNTYDDVRPVTESSEISVIFESGPPSVANVLLRLRRIVIVALEDMDDDFR